MKDLSSFYHLSSIWISINTPYISHSVQKWLKIDKKEQNSNYKQTADICKQTVDIVVKTADNCIQTSNEECKKNSW